MYRALLAGLLAGCVAALTRVHLPGTPDAFANSISTWLLVPFLVGVLASSPRRAASMGAFASLAQLVAFYVVAGANGLSTTVGLVLIWTVFAVGGGSVFGVAGRRWRAGGLAVLGGAFVLEGVLDTGWVWVAIGVALLVAGDALRPTRRRALRARQQ